MITDDSQLLKQLTGSEAEPYASCHAEEREKFICHITHNISHIKIQLTAGCQKGKVPS